MRQEQEEASSEVLEVADGVLRLQLPINVPGLRHVNCYAIVDRDGQRRFGRPGQWHRDGPSNHGHG